MKQMEYLYSLVLALLFLAGTVAWTQVSSGANDETVVSCRPGRASAPVVLKGMSLYPRCPGGKRG